MKDKKTDWFPGDVLPVNPGQYEVVVMQDLVSEGEVLAIWERRFGQWGFWKVDVWLDHTKSQLLKVLRWRGRVLPSRTVLIHEGVAVRPRQIITRGE